MLVLFSGVDSGKQTSDVLRKKFTGCARAVVGWHSYGGCPHGRSRAAEVAGTLECRREAAQSRPFRMGVSRVKMRPFFFFATA